MVHIKIIWDGFNLNIGTKIITEMRGEMPLANLIRHWEKWDPHTWALLHPGLRLKNDRGKKYIISKTIDVRQKNKYP